MVWKPRAHVFHMSHYQTVSSIRDHSVFHYQIVRAIDLGSRSSEYQPSPAVPGGQAKQSAVPGGVKTWCLVKLWIFGENMVFGESMFLEKTWFLVKTWFLLKTWVLMKTLFW